MKDKIIDLYEQGYPQKEICGILDLPYYKVNDVLKEQGYNTHSYRNIPEETSNMICLLIKEGYLHSVIADIMDTSVYIVRSVARRNNLQGVTINKRREDLENEVIDNYRSGKSRTQISKECHHDMGKIKQVLISSGDLRLPEKDSKDDKIYEAYKKGMSISKIISEYQTGYRRVKRIISEREAV